MTQQDTKGADAGELHPQPGLAEILPITAQLAGQSWGLLLSADLLPAAVDSANTLRPRLQDALEAELASAPGRMRWRVSFDSGDAAWCAVVERGLRRIRLGSPGFHHERAVAALIERLPFSRQREQGDRIAAWTEHAATWQAVDVDSAPTDIEAAIARCGLDDLIAPGPQLGSTLSRIETRAGALAQELLPVLGSHRAPMLERISQWGLGLQADYPLLRVHALRLIAALPALDHDRAGKLVAAQVSEMVHRTLDDDTRARLVAPAMALPSWLTLALRLGRTAIRVLPARLLAMLTRLTVQRVAGVFIAGEDAARAAPALRRLGERGCDATLDRLGEAVVTEAEADGYRDAVLDLIDGASAMYATKRNAAGLPLGHVSIKVSALTARFDADDPEGSLRRVQPRLRAILRRARERSVFVNIDAEHEAVRDLTIDVLARTLRSDADLRDFADVGIVLQAYLRDSAQHLDAILALCRTRSVQLAIRLVKGAYWDAETIEAEAHHERPAQWLNKSETDLCFQALTLRILRHPEHVRLAVGSHNLRDHVFARAAREVLAPEAAPVEHQCLYATYTSLAVAMARAGWPVRIYVPVGSMLTGMAYLVRRVMENSSQVGVLTMARQPLELDRLLESPAQALERQRRSGAWSRPAQLLGGEEALAFQACAPARLHRPPTRAAFDEALRAMRTRIAAGKDPLPWLDAAPSAPAAHGPALTSHSPEDAALCVGTLASATAADVDVAVAAARSASTAFAERGVVLRALALMRGGERLRARRSELAALVVFEAGKARAEALADIDEAIDFCQFYSREALRLQVVSRGASEPAPRGAIAVVAPWNFPIAIPCGLVAALATGNVVLLKSAEQTPLCAEALVRQLHGAGIPTDALIHLPGDGPTTGAALVAHEGVDGLVFTGSAAVGGRLYAQTAGRAARSGIGSRLAITEMGGKNAVFVAASADLDEAVIGCLRAAFGHAGQKCSALSRILIAQPVFERFAARFAAAAADLPIGAASAPGTAINPVISAEDRVRLLRTAAEAVDEAEAAGGRVLLDGRSALDGPGHLVAPTIVALPAEAAMANAASWALREVFGPIVHCIPVADLAEAKRVIAASPYALTGGLFTQRSDDIDAACHQPRAGNFYVNRAITGARVGVEPFGGFGCSGTGPKAGGDRYVAAFLQQRDALSSSVEIPAPSAVATAVRTALQSHVPTLGIPGQRTWNQRLPLAGQVLLVPEAGEASPRLRAHEAAALAAGAPEVRSVEVGAALEAIASGEAALVVFASHSPPAGLPAALQRRSSLLPLPRLVASDLDLDAIVDVHLHTATVAIHTLRHGAPLALPLPEVDDIRTAAGA